MPRKPPHLSVSGSVSVWALALGFGSVLGSVTANAPSTTSANAPDLPLVHIALSDEDCGLVVVNNPPLAPSGLAADAVGLGEAGSKV